MLVTLIKTLCNLLHIPHHYAVEDHSQKIGRRTIATRYKRTVTVFGFTVRSGVYEA